MTSLNDLPPCLLVKIFSNLPIDQVIRLKLVCKAWCEASAFVRYRSLCFYRFDFEEDDDRSLPKDCDLLVNDLEKFFKSAGSMVSGVQRLKIQLHAHPLNFEKNCLQNFLHRFKRVQELEILIFAFGDQLPDLILEFKLLRKMYLEIRYRFVGQRLELDCPQLSYLDIDCIANCRVSHPEKLQTLVVKVPLEEHQIRTFANLKNLVISTDDGRINSIPRTFYRSLPKSLQRLIIFSSDFFGEIGAYSYTAYRDSEENLRTHYAIDEEESSLRVFLCGIEMSLSQLEAETVWPFYSRENLRFMIRNLDKSVDGNVCFNRLLYYSTIDCQLATFDLLYKKICSDFPYSEVILNRNGVDQDRLLEFIRKVRPNRLRLRHAKHFPCTFFDRLAEIASPFIEELEFDSQAFDYEPGAFDFLFKMSGLNRILIENRKTVDLDLLLVAYEKFEDLCCISFHLGFSSFYPEPSRDTTISATFCPTNERADEVSRWLSVEDNEVSFNTLDVLRYLRDRLNGRQASFLELVLLTDELERQRQMNQFAFNVIVDYTKAIPIYL